MSVRDSALGILPAKRDYWVNMSMNAQRVGALPPYNDLLGGKMAALWHQMKSGRLMKENTKTLSRYYKKGN